MTSIRENVWELGNGWAEPILWYARAVGEMKARPLATKSSWRFYAAIHGFDPQLWGSLGYWSPSDLLPSVGDQKRYWKQCQHGSWYFLPWHRGYLLAFEATVRATVAELGGPTDWALPYWDYFKQGQNALPTEFAAQMMPDGSTNHLFVKQRYGPLNNGNVYVDTSETSLDPMGEPQFTGVESGGSRGFGGIDTGFEHGGRFHGELEQRPHDDVHGMVGGPSPRTPGLMSYPQTAGLDPIFWLHHANIDRLWEVWLRASPQHSNPSENNWLKGPAATGEQQFVMPMPDGSDWQYTPEQMGTLANLNYTYADLSAEGPAAPLAERLVNLAAPVDTINSVREGVTVKRPTSVELLGANEGALRVSGGEARTRVKLHPAVRQKVLNSLNVAALGPTEIAPDRVFLTLENVRGVSDGARLKVYVKVPDTKPVDHPERLAGTISLFGMHKASDRNGEHAGQGLTLSLEITKIIDSLHLENALSADNIDVKLVPAGPMAEDESITIGRVSVTREGQ